MPAGVERDSTKSANCFEEIFQAATGVSVSVYSYLGHCANQPATESIPEVCQKARSTPEGCKRCESFHQKLMLSAKNGPVSRICPEGLTESAIPIRSDHATFGYLLAGQVVIEDSHDEKTLRNLNDELSCAIQTTPRLSPERYQAVIALLEREANERAQYAKASQPNSQPDSLVDTKVPLPLSIAAAIRYIHSKLEAPISLGEVAAQVALSPEHFSRKFHDSTGITFLNYVNEARIMQAKDLLTETCVSISEIAFDSGFASISQFNRVFKNLTGLSPSSFRKQNQSTVEA